MSMTKIWSSRP